MGCIMAMATVGKMKVNAVVLWDKTTVTIEIRIVVAGVKRVSQLKRRGSAGGGGGRGSSNSSTGR